MIILEGGIGDCEICNKELKIDEYKYCERCLSNESVSTNWIQTMLNKILNGDKNASDRSAK